MLQYLALYIDDCGNLRERSSALLGREHGLLVVPRLAALGEHGLVVVRGVVHVVVEPGSEVEATWQLQRWARCVMDMICDGISKPPSPSLAARVRYH